MTFFLERMKNKLYQDISNFLQDTSFAHQFRFLVNAKTSKDIVNIKIDSRYTYSIFRISQTIFSVTREWYTPHAKMTESALIECYYHTFTIIDHFIRSKQNKQNKQNKQIK